MIISPLKYVLFLWANTEVEAALWDDINFLFKFRTEVVYPTDHVFTFFRIFIFLQIFLINISMKPEVTQTNYLFTWRTIQCFHSIGHMLIASAQRWVNNQCCRCILIRGNMWCKVLNIADFFCLHGNIRPGNTTISLFFGALKLFFDFFVFSVEISRLYSFI